MLQPQQLESFALFFSHYLFQPNTSFFRLPEGGEVEVHSWAGGKVRGLDIGEYRVVTQNPNKASEWGKRARAGDHIAWVIHRPTNKWLVRVVNGCAEIL